MTLPAAELRRRWPQPEYKGHLDKVRIIINGEVYWLWRAVDQNNQCVPRRTVTRYTARAIDVPQEVRWCCEFGDDSTYVLVAD